MHALIAYSQPRGKFGRYVFTVMIHFSEQTEKAEIAVIRPQTETRTVYSCDHCGRWHTIQTHITFTAHQKLSQSEYYKDGRLELYRYDNVEPNDWIELTLRDSELLKYQWTYISIGWENVSLKNYWRDPRKDKDWNTIIETRKQAWENQQRGFPNQPKTPFPTLTQRDRQENLNEKKMTKEVLYEIPLLAWDEYIQSQSGEMRVEEELIRKTMNAEEITIQELILEPISQLPAIQGQQQFIEGELRYLIDR